MTSNEARATTLVRALRAGIEGDREALQALFTDDVRAWTPALSTTSLSELIDELDRRDDAFSDIELDVVPLDVGGDYACVEWTVEMTHSGTHHARRRAKHRAVRHPGHVARCHGRRVRRRADLFAAAVLGRVRRARAARRPDRARREQLCAPRMMEAFDAWELRWIARDLPTLDAAGLPPSSLDPEFRVVYEHDVYVLTGSDRINLKVRHRENSLKLKRLFERTGDGFERWRTEFDAPLPAGPERFRDVLDLIGRAGSPERLGAAHAPVRWSSSWTRSVVRRSWLRCTSRATGSSAEPVGVDAVRFRTRGTPIVRSGSRAAASRIYGHSCRT